MPVGAKIKSVVQTMELLPIQPSQLGVKMSMIMVLVQHVRADIGHIETMMETLSALSPVHQTCTHTLLRNGVYHAIQNGTSAELTLQSIAVIINLLSATSSNQRTLLAKSSALMDTMVTIDGATSVLTTAKAVQMVIPAHLVLLTSS